MTFPCKKAELVSITWVDAVGESMRLTEDDIDCKLATNTNVGWIVRETDDVVALAHGMSSTGEYDVFKVPKSCILSIESFVKRKCKSPVKATG
jgi:hypothetical protein